MIRSAQAVAGSLRVDEVNDVEVLESYRLLWNALLPQTRQATFLQSLDWLATYWRHHGRGQRLRVLVVSARGKPVGILPLAVRRKRTLLGIVRVLGYPLDERDACYGPIGPNATATLLGGLRHIRNTRRDWDLLDLRGVDADGCDHGRTPHAMRMAGFPAHKQLWHRAARIQLDGNWEEYWESRPREWRDQLDGCLRRLSQRGRLTHLRYRPDGAAAGDGDPRWGLYDACGELDARTATGNGPARRDTVRAFGRDLHAAAARCGCLDLNLLLLDDRPVAFLSGHHYDGRHCGIRIGSAAEWKSLRPECVLQRMVLEDGYRRGDRSYDWGPGIGDGRHSWQTASASSYRYVHYPLTAPRAQLLRMRTWLADRLAVTGRPADSENPAPLAP